MVLVSCVIATGPMAISARRLGVALTRARSAAVIVAAQVPAALTAPALRGRVVTINVPVV